MMKKNLLVFVFATAFSLSAATYAFAQTPHDNSSTEQTDQSEEDWRKSKKKSSSKDVFDPFKNTSKYGFGTSLPPLRPIDNLPQESRRHLMRQRAEVIATMEFGSDDKPKPNKETEFEPSEAAKTDPELAKEEEEVWKIILTDLQSGKGTNRQSGQNGPNKIAIAGRGNSQNGSLMRGGSTQSVAEILAKLKGYKPNPINGNGGLKPLPNKLPNLPTTLPTGPLGQSGGQGAQQGQQSGQATQEQTQSQPSQNPTDVSAQRGGSAQNVSDILSGIKEQSSKSTSDSSQSDQSTRPQSQPQILSPLSLPKPETTSTPQTICSQSSASAYLKRSQNTDGAKNCK